MERPRRVLPPIVLLLAAGLILRLLLAYVLLPDSGLITDLYSYARWGTLIAQVGPGAFYDAAGFANYPPGYLYVLWLVGEIGVALAPAMNLDAMAATTSLLKIPPMLLDVVAAFLLYYIVHEGLVDSERRERTALLAAALYLFNPVTWYDSAIWGQTDAAGACVMLAGTIALLKGPAEIAAAIAVLAALIKPQFGVVLGPLVGIVLLKRHLTASPIRLLTSALVGIVVFYALVLPFNLGLHSFLERMTETAERFPILSVNAYNPWALVGSGDTPALAFTPSETFVKHGVWARDDIPLVGTVTGVAIGTVLLGLGFLIGAARLLWRTDRCSIILVGAYLCLCFFMLPTRVHERYILVAYAFLSLLGALDRRWLWATVALSVGTLINLHGVLTMQVHGTPNILRLPFGDFGHSLMGVLVSCALHTAVFIFVVWRLYATASKSEAIVTEPLLART